MCEWIPSFAKFVSTSAYLDRLADVKKELKTKTDEIRRNRTRVDDEEAKLDEDEIVKQGAEEEEEEEEEEEVDESYFVTDENGKHVRDENGHLIVDYSRVKTDAFKQMAIGTILVLVFSDPMCGVFTSIGERTSMMFDTLITRNLMLKTHTQQVRASTHFTSLSFWLRSPRTHLSSLLR